MTKAEAQARVQRGAAFLDEHKPGWYRAIDPAALRLMSGSCCVIGQVCGHFAAICGDDIALTSARMQARLTNADLGFITLRADGVQQDPQGSSMLEEAWLDAASARLGAEQDAPVVAWTMRELVR